MTPRSKSGAPRAAAAREKKVFAKIEKEYGYPLLERKELVDALSDQFEAAPPAEIFEHLVDDNIHWKAEGHTGDYHEDPEMAELLGSAQRPDVLARHFAGLFAFGNGPSGGSTTHRSALLADLNPRRDGLQLPVYTQSIDEDGPLRGKITPWFVFESPRPAVECVSLSFRLASDLVEDLEKHRQEAQELTARSPRACVAYAAVFRQLKVKLPAGPKSFPDPDGERLLAVHDALLPIADVIVTRVSGKSATLSSADAKRCAELADTKGDHPPALLLALLTPALSGKMEIAKKVAEQILEEQLGVPLTRTWARKVQGDEPPFRS